MLTLHKFQHFVGMSEETSAFRADLKFDGKVCGDAKNDGQGGSTMVWFDYAKVTDRAALLESARAIVRAEAERYLLEPEEWLQKLGRETLADLDAGTDTEHATLESAVDALVTLAIEAKEKARIDRWIAKGAKASAAKGFPITVVLRNGENVRTAGLKTREQMPAMAEKWGVPVERLEVVTV